MKRLDDAWMITTTEDLLAAAVDRDYDNVQDRIMAIAEQRGAAGVWGLCCVLAHAVMEHGLGAKRGVGLAMFQLQTDDGRPVEPEDAPPEMRAQIWAIRVVTAYANNQGDAALALFTSSLADPERHMEGMAALIKLAADVLREKVGEPS